MKCKTFSQAILFILIFSLIGCIKIGENLEISRVESPDDKYYAIVFVRNGSATTDFSTQISILNKNSVLGNATGNLFTCDSDHGKAASLEDHSCWVKLSWTSPTELLIQYDKRVRVFEKKGKFKAINIHYSPVEALSSK